MKSLISKFVLAFLVLSAGVQASHAADDWAQFAKYSSQNDSVRALGEAGRPKVVFMGNSITEGWVKLRPDFFKNNNFIGRGISGQTTDQMLVRFREDVINLRPEIVVINGGTNDIATNGGDYNEDVTFGNLVSMVELAEANGLKVVLTSVLPVEKYFWSPDVLDAPEKIDKLNRRIKAYAEGKGYPYVDYFSMMNEGGYKMKDGLSYDGVHPKPEGYEIMEALVLPVVMRSEKKPIRLSLWQERDPGVQNGIPVEAETEESSGWITHVASPELLVFPAVNPDGRALLMCPGGGYYGVAIEHEGTDMADVLNSAGITLAVLKYRMPNGHSEVPAKDVREAMRILKDRASEWGIDDGKIGIGGASAGGHLASTIAVHPVEGEMSPAFQVLLYPVISMRDGLTHEGSRGNLLGEAPSAEAVEYYSNELHVSPATPPAFIALSGDDTVVPVDNSILYYEALRNNGVPASLHIYPAGGHGWGMRPGFAYSREWIEELLGWMNKLYQ